MKRIFALMLCTTFIFAKCNKDDEPAPASSNFQPTSANSTWNYTSTNLANNATASFVLTATNRDSVINSRTYRVFTNSGGGNEYYSPSGNDYYQFGRFEAIGQNVELLYLKAGSAVGTTWEESRNVTISNVTIPVKFTFTIAEKDISYTVAGKAYSKVTRVNVTLAATGVPITAQNISFYYADGVGRIQSNVRLAIPLASIDANTRTDLTNYSIAP